MSFRDELLASLKTPQEVAAEKETEAIREAKRNAASVFSLLVSKFKTNASQGNYWDDGTHKHLCIIVDDSHLGDYFNKSVKQVHERRGFFGNDIRTFACFSVTCKNETLLNVYINELKRIASPDGIEVEPVAIHYRVLEGDTVFSIPGGSKISCFDTSTHNIRFGIRARMTL